jgi:hypothetical protein
LQQVPLEAHFQQEVDDERFDRAFSCLYQYFDLSNEQAFLRMNGRISRVTWLDWSAGMKTTMSKPMFAKAWDRVCESTTSFGELRRLMNCGFADDPYTWVPFHRRVRRWVRQ